MEYGCAVSEGAGQAVGQRSVIPIRPKPALTILRATSRNVAHIDCHYPRNTLLYHGNAIDDIGTGDCTLIVRDDNELRLIGEFSDDVIELIDVGVVQRSVDLIEDAERCRLK